MLQGSCGYGDMDKSKYPFWSVAALSTSNSFYKAGPINGCGECFEIKCLNSGGKFAVSNKGVGFTVACTSLCAPVRDLLAGRLISILFVLNAMLLIMTGLKCIFFDSHMNSHNAGPLQLGSKPAKRHRHDHRLLPRM